MREDLRYAVRRLLNAPVFSLSIVLILASGITAATTMGSIVNALVYKPLALPDAPTLVTVSSLDKRGLSRTTPLTAIAHLRRANLAAHGWCGYGTTLDATESARRVIESYGEMLTGDCLEVIGLEPVLGRWFTSEEAPLTGAGGHVMVITDRYWSRMFDRRSDVIGQTVRIQNAQVTVIGVMPPVFTGFTADIGIDFIIPFNAHRASSGPSQFLGRLDAGATLPQLRSQVEALWPAVLREIWPAGPTREQMLAELSGGAASASGGFSSLRRLYASIVQRLTAVSAIVLLLVALNVGGLLFSRVAARTHEIDAMRALGASAMRVARPLVFECGLLSLAGACVGVAAAMVAATGFTALLPIGNQPWRLDASMDVRLLVAAAIVTVLVAGVVMIMPISLAVRRKAQLRGDRGVSRSTSTWAKGLLVAQVAVTVMLVFTSGLVMRSFATLRSVDRGYEPEHLLSLRLAANPGGYQGMDAPRYYKSLLDEISNVAGVEGAGMAKFFGTINGKMPEQPIGFADDTENITTGTNDFVSPGFFAAAGVPLLGGRDIAWSDLPSTTKVAVVSESLARALTPDGDVVGRMIRFSTTPIATQLQIIGVVGNLSMGNVRDTTPRMIFQPAVQMEQTSFATIHIRAAGGPLTVAAPASAAVARLGREHVLGAYAHDMLFINSMVPERMASVVSGTGATFALAISCIGLFALLSHSVERRTREIGIRVAIGATPAAISRIVIGDALRLVVAGLAIGLPAGVAATAFVQSLLFNVSTTDVVTFAVSIAAIILTALLATTHPTWRATKVDAAQSLRAE